MGDLIPFPTRHEAWVDQKVLAEHFSVSESTVKRWREAGLPTMKFGRAVRFRIGEAEGWLSAPKEAS